MSTEFHTALAYGASLSSSVMEAPLSQLDSALGTYGLWTPTLAFATPGSSTFTPGSYHKGYYHVIGDRVFIDAQIYGDINKGTASGSLDISGLPFDTWDDGLGTYYPTGAAATDGTGLTMRSSSYGLTASVFYSGGTYVNIYWNGVGSSVLTASDFTAGSHTITINISINYRRA